MLGSVAREGAASVASTIWAKPAKYFFDVICAAGDRMSALGATVAKGTSAWSVLKGRGRVPEDDPGNLAGGAQD
jgi:hypothetical protein